MNAEGYDTDLARYGDQFATVGTTLQDASGKYLLRSKDSDCSCPPSYISCVSSPTYDGSLLIRVEAKNNNTDLPFIDNYFNNTSITPTNLRNSTFSPLSTSDFAGLSNTSFPEKTLELTARLASRNPPATPELAAHVPTILSCAGVNTTSQTYTAPSGVNLTEAYSLFNSTIASFSTTNSTNLTNSWMTFNPSYIGTYNNGQDVVARAYVSMNLYLGNAAQEALYVSPQESLSLTDSTSYLLSFGGTPPISDRDGFWSVTMYGADQFLVPNMEGVYALGDRSNLTYEGDGSFQILIQDTNVPPPSNWTNK
jgi:hypothetical protein